MSNLKFPLSDQNIFSLHVLVFELGALLLLKMLEKALSSSHDTIQDYLKEQNENPLEIYDQSAHKGLIKNDQQHHGQI